MSKIIIGTAHQKNVSLDLDLLLSTRALLTADSGGGKTFALKRIVEKAFGKIQIIILDPEGEFSPLREKLDFVLVGKGGETPADIRSAALVAQTILKLRASVIIDLYEMKPSERHVYVKNFLDALIEAPKEMRHPCLVIVDEAHIFCPEHGKGESVASESMIGLCTRGRKRLLCPLFATQRLATLSKDASSMLLNRMIGPTFEDINRKRAADVLGIAKDGQKEFYRQIQTLDPGYFFCLGRAISKEMVLVHVGPIETPHGQEALKYEMTPPPAPEKIKALLPKLTDLPKEAEEKARTEAEFRHEIRDLKTRLKAAEKAQPAAAAPATKADPHQARADARTIRELRALLEDAMKITAKINAIGFEGADVKPEEISAAIEKAAAEVGKIAGQKIAMKRRELESLKAEVNRLLAKLNARLSDENIKIAVDLVKQEPVTVHQQPSRPLPPARVREPRVVATGNGEIKLGRTHQEIAGILAGYYPDAIKRSVLAVMCGKVDGGTFGNRLSELRVSGLLEDPGPGLVKATEQCSRDYAGVFQAPTNTSEVLAVWYPRLNAANREILDYLVGLRGEPIHRGELAAALNKADGGTFGNRLSELRVAGLIVDPGKALVAANKEALFLDAA
jgi:hypothetical protein